MGEDKSKIGVTLEQATPSLFITNTANLWSRPDHAVLI